MIKERKNFIKLYKIVGTFLMLTINRDFYLIEEINKAVVAIVVSTNTQ